MKDVNLRKSVALPNAANTVNTNTIELPQQATRPFTTNIRVGLYNTVATGANSKNINYVLYASNESNGANAVVASQTFTVVGNGTNHAASDREFYLGPELDKKYIFASATGEANGGNAADGTLYVEIVD